MLHLVRNLDDEEPTTCSSSDEEPEDVESPDETEEEELEEELRSRDLCEWLRVVLLLSLVPRILFP